MSLLSSSPRMPPLFHPSVPCLLWVFPPLGIGGFSGGPQRKHPAISFLRWWQELTLPQDAKPQSGILTPRLYSNSDFLGYLIHHPLAYLVR